MKKTHVKIGFCQLLLKVFLGKNVSHRHGCNRSFFHTVFRIWMDFRHRVE